MFQLGEKLRGFLLLRSTHRCLENFSQGLERLDLGVWAYLGLKKC